MQTSVAGQCARVAGTQRTNTHRHNKATVALHQIKNTCTNRNRSSLISTKSTLSIPLRQKALSSFRISAVAESFSPPEANGDEDDEEDDSRTVAVRMAEVADGLKAEDILVLHVEHVCSWTRYFVLITARSRPQMDALMVKMRDAVKEEFDRDFQKNPESGGSAWAVMDLGDVVAHVFSAQEREYYDLESFYQEAEVVPLPFPSSSEW